MQTLQRDEDFCPLGSRSGDDPDPPPLLGKRPAAFSDMASGDEGREQSGEERHEKHETRENRETLEKEVIKEEMGGRRRRSRGSC